MKNKKLLILGYVWPEPNSSAAGQHMVRLIQLFSSHNYEITFACAALETPYQSNLTALKINLVSIQLNDSSFDQLLKDINPSIVLFDRFMLFEQFAWRVEEKCPNAIKLLDTEDLHSLREARQLELKKNPDYFWKNNIPLLNSEKYFRELSCILRADLSLIISDFEYQLLIKDSEIDEKSLHYLPLKHSEINKSNQEEWSNFTERNDFVFIGNFLHAPNLDAVHFLKNKLWPQIRKKLPKAQLHIYGAYMNQYQSQLSNEKQGFILKGRAENPLEIISNYRVSLAPLRFGAGIKGKLLESMTCGTPSVTTPIGSEGITPVSNWPGKVCLNETDFIDSSVSLFSDEQLWIEKQQVGLSLINNQFTTTSHEELLFKKIEAINLNIEQHRSKSLLNRIINFQSKKGDKYFSKWIEEKNKVSNSF